MDAKSFGRRSSSRITGASLITSGLVPMTVMTARRIEAEALQVKNGEEIAEITCDEALAHQPQLMCHPAGRPQIPARG